MFSPLIVPYSNSCHFEENQMCDDVVLFFCIGGIIESYLTSIIIIIKPFFVGAKHPRDDADKCAKFGMQTRSILRAGRCLGTAYATVSHRRPAEVYRQGKLWHG